MKLKIFLAILFLLLLVGGLGGIKALQIMKLIESGENMQIPPTAVVVGDIDTREWAPFIPSVGSVSAVEGVTLSSEEAGTVSEIAFESGKPVKKGDLLVSLDTSSEAAFLRSAQADADLANLNLERARDLFKRRAVAQSELDTAEAEAKRAAAAVDRFKVTIDKKTIKAPFAGIAGIRKVNPGQYLAVGDPIVSLQAMDPVYVDFTMPQKRLAELKAGLGVRVFSDSAPGVSLPGNISSIDSQVDPLTRNVAVRATLPNPEGRLLPGMFVRIEVDLPKTAPVSVIPISAVINATYGDSVYVVEEETDPEKPQGLVARQHFVRLGERRGDFVAIESGLKPGAKVVTEGAFKLRNNTPVKLGESGGGTPSETPAPPEA